MLKIISLLIFLAISSIGFAQLMKPPIFQADTHWCDSLMKNMTLDQKIGQLLMVTTYPANGAKNEKQIVSWIKNQHVGGVLFLKTSPSVLKTCAIHYQSEANIPLFIAIDAENGLSFRMDSVVKYPHLMGLGAVSDNSLIYRMGREVGQQCKALGINVNFAPVADVNSNMNNPVINYRSFGENPQRVAAKTWQLAKGMQDEGIIVSIKHFPGHGDTSNDSHFTMPIIERDYSQLDSVDFVPFKYCIENGVNGIMSAHIGIPNLDSSNRPSTLSGKIMTGVLRDSLKFEGLVFSDGMNMKGITSLFNEGTAAVEALKAGVDVLEFVLNPDVVIDSVKKAIDRKEISDSLIDAKCRKVLMGKTWLGLNRNVNSEKRSVPQDIRQMDYQLTARKLYMNSITVVQNRDSIIPLQRLDTLKIATLSIGNGSANSVFQQQLGKYMAVDHFTISSKAESEEIKRTIRKLKTYNLVIAGVFGTRMSTASNFSVRDVHKVAINELLTQNKTIVAFFANPYSLNQYDSIGRAQSIIVTYGENEQSQDFTAQLIFGAIGTESKLPVTINSTFTEGSGCVVRNIGRLKYGIPEEEGIKSSLLKTKIDSFAYLGIQQKMFPGCQILVSKNGNIIFQEGFGYYTYQKLKPVTNESIYDLASLTKIFGPLPLIMKLVNDSIWKLDVPFSRYWEGFVNTNKQDITLRAILAHQARFKPALNLVHNVMKPRNQWMYLRDRPSTDYPTRIATNLYIRENFKAEMYKAVAQSELLPTVKYEYTDLPFYLFPGILTNYFGESYEIAHRKKFLLPIGATGLYYNPYQHFFLEEIVPTEIDLNFRKELIQGFVHDEGAAMLGGVSGNAGLFGTTNDLAKVLQFYLNGGSYGDFVFLKPSTLNEFNKTQYSGNRRGLGFDKPYINNHLRNIEDAYPANAVSSSSFGHTGFTGTMVWVDPENQMIFVFLSNRIFPNRDNRRLIDINFRPKLQQAIYNCQNSFSTANY
jgi:beta-glucosidase-like glycosyl hydrolase/CubicO group peptidase (beta-lactamase class C family)